MKDFYNENFKTLKKETKPLDSRKQLFTPGRTESALYVVTGTRAVQQQPNAYQNAHVILQRSRGKPKNSHGTMTSQSNAYGVLPHPVKNGQHQEI